MQGPWFVAFFKFCLPPAPDDANAMPSILLSGSAEPMILLPDAMALNMDESKALELQKHICDDAEPEIDEDEPATKKKKGKPKPGKTQLSAKGIGDQKRKNALMLLDRVSKSGELGCHTWSYDVTTLALASANKMKVTANDKVQ